jgi:F0F1-type ATP synthase delta subunit
MNKVSRRSLARWAADQLTDGQPATAVAKRLAAALKESGMNNQANFLIDDIAWELEQRGALTIGKVTSAHPLSRQLEKYLAAQIKKVTKANSSILETSIDKSVIGGLRVETASRVWDTTVSRQLSELKEIYK